MRNVRFFGLLILPVVMLSAGCAEVSTREHVIGRLSHSQSQVFPDEAVWMGDANGYHYIHVRNIYNYLGDSDYVVPVSQWDLPDPFPLTDNANHWRNVQWEDKEALMRSRFSYVLLEPRERVASPSARAPGTNTQSMQPPPTSQLGNQQLVPATQPTSQP